MPTTYLIASSADSGEFLNDATTYDNTGTWLIRGFPGGGGPTVYVGAVRFQLWTPQVDERGRAIDPPRTSSLVLNLNVTQSVPISNTLSVYYLPILNPLEGIDPAGEGPPYPSGYWDAVQDPNNLVTTVDLPVGAGLLSIPLDVNAALGTGTSLFQQMCHPNFLGFMSFGFTTSNTGNTITVIGAAGDRPSATTDETPFITGLAGMKPLTYWSRSYRCEKCGHLTMKEKLIEDSWFKGMWVCTKCWDDEEPHETVIPPDLPPLND
jgi:hypothetical protein